MKKLVQMSQQNMKKTFQNTFIYLGQTGCKFPEKILLYVKDCLLFQTMW